MLLKNSGRDKFGRLNYMESGQLDLFCGFTPAYCAYSENGHNVTVELLGVPVEGWETKSVFDHTENIVRTFPTWGKAHTFLAQFNPVATWEECVNRQAYGLTRR